MESRPAREAGSFGWGVAWFFWNLPIALTVISLVYVTLTLVERVSSDGVDVPDLINGYLLAVPCYSFLGWLAGSGLIAALWATGVRNPVLARLPVAVVSVLLAVPASGNRWMAIFFACSGLGLAVALRLPGSSGATTGTRSGSEAQRPPR